MNGSMVLLEHLEVAILHLIKGLIELIMRLPYQLVRFEFSSEDTYIPK